MAGFSDAFIQNILNEHFGATAHAAASTYYFALFTTAPNDNGAGGVEVTGGSYARVSVTNNTTNFPAAALSAGQVVNGTAITFPTATGAWGDVVAVGIYKHITNQNSADFIGWVAKTQTVANGDIVTIPIGGFSASLT